MSAHLSVDRRLALAEGDGDAASRAHAVACALCRAEIDELRGAFEALRADDGDVPEPAPAYWEAFRRQVARRLDDDARAPRRRPLWLWLPALAGAGVLALAVAPRVAWHGAVTPASPAPASAAVLPAWTPLPEGESDEGLSVLQGLASTGAMSAADECSGLAECVADLDEADARALAQEFSQELGGKS